MLDTYTPDFIRKDLFVDDVPVKTKFGIVHGGKGSTDVLVGKAVEAKLSGEVDKLVFTGGARVFDPLTLVGIVSFNGSYFTENGLAEGFNRVGGFLSPKKEALFMEDKAMKLGVSHKDIIVEGNGNPTSSHTGQNVDNLISKTNGLYDDIVEEGALKVFGLVYNTRRLCSVWERKLNVDRNQDVIIVPRSFYPYGFTSENWSTSKDIRDRIVYPEMVKIDLANPGSHHYITSDVAIYNAERHRQAAIDELPSCSLS